MITVKDYYENEALLELEYIPYQQKIDIVNAILDTIKLENENFIYFDLVTDRPTYESVIIQSLTNIDMTEVDEYGLNGFDTLFRLNIYDKLIFAIKDEFNTFIDILNKKVRFINQIELSNSAIINKIMKSLSTMAEFGSSQDFENVKNALGKMEQMGVLNGLE